MPWTITGGTTAITFNSMIEFEINDHSQVANILIEKGSFTNYNKTDDPLEVRVVLGYQGTDAEKEAALSAIKAMKNSLDLVSLETPEAFYESLNIEAYTYVRSADTGPLLVQLSLVEIREVEVGVTTGNNTVGNSKNPTSVDTVDTGTSNTKTGLLYGLLNG